MGGALTSSWQVGGIPQELQGVDVAHGFFI